MAVQTWEMNLNIIKEILTNKSDSYYVARQPKSLNLGRKIQNATMDQSGRVFKIYTYIYQL